MLKSKPFKNWTEEEIFRYRISSLATQIRYSFTEIMQHQKGVWRDQLFAHVEDKRFMSICPITEHKYLDRDKVVFDMTDLISTLNVTEAIYTTCRPLELSNGPIDTFNIIYIGSASWGGRSLCVPYMYSQRLNDTWTFEHSTFDKIADLFNKPVIDMLRSGYYGSSNISFEQKVRNLTNKGYRIFDRHDIAEKKVGAVIAAIGDTNY